MSLITSDKQRMIIGVGQTGLSVARYLSSRGLPFAVCDTRNAGKALEVFESEFSHIDFYKGELDADKLSNVDEIILSPGVAKDHPAIQEAISHGSKVVGDIDLFVREVTSPIIAITGSNGKSTVTTLVGQMASDAGINVKIGGNIGIPVLDLLEGSSADLYVLELSSFQLETTHELRATAATVLNMSADHMDRYEGMQAYHSAKHRIYRHCQQAIFNREDALSRPLVPNTTRQVSFGLTAPDLKQFGRLFHSGETWLAQGAKALMAVSDMKLRGTHNELNALAALALGESVGLPIDCMLQTLKQFAGLEHRCEWVGEIEGVDWFNDSKGTNVGATLAAIEGLGRTLDKGNQLILIAGGQAKDQSFSSLKVPVDTHVKSVILIGHDADILAQQLDHPRTLRAKTMTEAVQMASEDAHSGDVVLLSPACASFDMFKSFEDRGDQFKTAVKGLL